MVSNLVYFNQAQWEAPASVSPHSSRSLKGGKNELNFNQQAFIEQPLCAIQLSEIDSIIPIADLLRLTNVFH